MVNKLTLKLLEGWQYVAMYRRIRRGSGLIWNEILDIPGWAKIFSRGGGGETNALPPLNEIL